MRSDIVIAIVAQACWLTGCGASSQTTRSVDAPSAKSVTAASTAGDTAGTPGSGASAAAAPGAAVPVTAPPAFARASAQAVAPAASAPSAPTNSTAIVSGPEESTPVAGSATLTWLAPEPDEDGEPAPDLAGFNVYYGSSPTALTNRISIMSAETQSIVINGLAPGNWYFAVTAVNNEGVESAGPLAVEAALL